jgi:HlyD family secretion protein
MEMIRIDRNQMGWGLMLLAALFCVGCAAQPPVELIEGTLECDEVDVSAKVPGRLVEVRFEEGSPVKAGEVIARLDSKEIDAKVAQAAGAYEAALAKREQAAQALKLQKLTVESQIRQAESAYAAAQARLKMVLSGARPQEIRQVEKGVEQAIAADNAASSAYERFHGLYSEGVISQQAEEEVRLRYLSAKAQREAAEARLELTREGARKEEIEQARQGVAAAEAALKMARDSDLQSAMREQDVAAALHQAEALGAQLDEARAYQSETRLIAPMDGYVSEKNFNSGEMVAAGSPVITLVRKSDFKVKVYVDETKFGNIQIDSPVKIIVPALGNTEFAGRVIRISQAAEFATKKATNEMNSYDVRALQIVVRIINEDVRLRTGMTARAEFPVRES